MPLARRIVAWLPAIGWALLIFWFSAQPNLRFAQDELLDLVVRKLGHMGVFGILALLVWRGLAVTTPARPAWAWAAGLSLLYAATDEFHQAFTPGREPTIRDVAIDGLGIAIAVVIARAVLGWRAKRGRREG